MSEKGVSQDPEYDVCLSYASAQREYVRTISNLLKAAGARVFMDEDVVADVWGSDALDLFQHVYYGGSRYCLVFVSEEYAASAWTDLERRAAQAHAFAQKQEYVLPIQIDNTQLPGPAGNAYSIRAEDYSPQQIVGLVLEKLRRDGRQLGRARFGKGAVSAHVGPELLEQVSAAGLVAIENRADPRFASPPALPIQVARDELIISAISGKYTFTRLTGEIGAALARGVAVRAMLLHPDSPDASLLQEIEPIDLRADIASVAKLVSARFADHPLFDIRYLEKAPPFTAVMADDRQRPGRAAARTIRVQPSVRYQSQHKGLILVFESMSGDDGASQTPYEYFAHDLRQHWARGIALR